jgi:hypothetical protein
MKTPIVAVSIVLALSARPIVGSADGRPTLHVTVDDRSAAGATELGTARTRASHIFDDAGIRLSWKSRGAAPDAGVAADGYHVHLVVLGGSDAEQVIGRSGILGFAIPSANRVYVHYDRVHALARNQKVQPGWFLGVVIAHELAHVLGSEHHETGVMASRLSPDANVPPTFSSQEAQSIRTRVQSRRLGPIP